MEKKIYGLLGEHLTHSYSPAIHAALGDYEYRLFEVAPADLPSFLEEDVRRRWSASGKGVPQMLYVL